MDKTTRLFARIFVLVVLFGGTVWLGSTPGSSEPVTCWVVVMTVDGDQLEIVGVNDPVRGVVRPGPDFTQPVLEPGSVRDSLFVICR